MDSEHGVPFLIYLKLNRRPSITDRRLAKPDGISNVLLRPRSVHQGLLCNCKYRGHFFSRPMPLHSIPTWAISVICACTLPVPCHFGTRNDQLVWDYSIVKSVQYVTLFPTAVFQGKYVYHYLSTTLTTRAVLGHRRGSHVFACGNSVPHVFGRGARGNHTGPRNMEKTRWPTDGQLRNETQNICPIK